MNYHLVFVHGRSQHDKDPDELKRVWVNSWKEGLAKSGLALPLSESNIRFPYYGQALFDLVSDSAAEPAEIQASEQQMAMQEILESACVNFRVVTARDGRILD